MTSDKKSKTKVDHGPHGLGKNKCSHFITKIIGSCLKFGHCILLGDPDDKTLRKMEENLLIPQIRRKIVKEEKCPKEIEGCIFYLLKSFNNFQCLTNSIIVTEYQNCVNKTGLILAAFKCKDLKLKLADCLEFWNEDEDLYRRAKNLYLEERTEYRRTGISREKKEYLTKYINEMQK